MRSAVKLGFSAAADANVLPEARQVTQPFERFGEHGAVVTLEVVDLRLQSVGWAERLGQNELPGCKVDANAILEGRIRLVVDVDRNRMLGHKLLEVIAVNAEAEVENVTLLLRVG